MSSKKSFKMEILIVVVFFAVIGGIVVLSSPSEEAHDHGDGKVHSHP